MSSDRRQVPARSDGAKLYVELRLGEPEVAFDWNGRTGVHHAIVDTEFKYYAYGAECCEAISVFDAESTWLGSVEYTHWY